MNYISQYKQLLFCSLFLFVYCGLFAQTTAIPDSNFEQILVDQGIDSNGLNGNILDSDALAVTDLSIPSNNIDNVIGINAFQNLVSLSIAENNLTSIAPTYLIDLESIYIENNRQLTTVNLTQNYNLIEIIIIDTEDIERDNNQLVTLDLSQNFRLEYLELRNLGNLSNLSLPNTGTLTEIYLEYLSVVYYDFRPYVDLEILHFIGVNTPAVVNFDFPSDITDMHDIKLAYVELLMVDFEQYINLESLELLYTRISELILPKTNTLEKVWVVGHELNSPVNIEDAPEINSLIIADNLTNPTIPFTVDLSANPKIEHLELWNNYMTSVDVSDLPLLEYLDVNHNELTNLNLSQNPLLTYLNAGYNQLPTIDLSVNLLLESLILENNLIPTLDVNMLSELEHLDISNNLFTATGLDLSQNQKLIYLNASYNQITELDITKNILLRGLNVSHNLFTGTSIMDQYYTIRQNDNGISDSNPFYFLNVSHNQLSGTIPNFAKQVSYTGDNLFLFDLIFNDNKFVFGDFEEEHLSYIDLYNTKLNPPWDFVYVLNEYRYAPQAKVLDIEYINVNSGEDVTLSSLIGGAQNHYKWFKDGVEIPNSDSAELTLSNLSFCDQAVYHAEIISDLVPFENDLAPGTDNRNLLLVRNDITINVNGGLEQCEQITNIENGEIDVPVDTNIEWNNTVGACGYYLSVGTTPGGSDIVNQLDVGDTTSFDFPNDLPDDTTIYTTLTPYFNSTSTVSISCQEISFTTENLYCVIEDIVVQEFCPGEEHFYPDGEPIPNEPGVYTYEILENNQPNCDILHKYTTTIFSPQAPNSISPNNDGINDSFHLIFGNCSGISEFELNIFNRWGEQVFQTNNVHEEWTAENQPLDTYLWYMKYKYNDQPQQKKGIVHLIP